MPLTQEEKDKRERLLIDAARVLDPSEAIDASDPRYVDCARVRGEEGILVEPALAGDLPFTEKDIQFTFRRIIRDYETSPADEDFDLLARVYTNFSISNDNDHFRMLNNHFIFAYVNEETWYDVHPALQEVSKFKDALQRLKGKKKTGKPLHG